MADVIHTVVKGDTLSEIAAKYRDQYYPGKDIYNDVVPAIAKLNNIKDYNLIYIGQKLKITGTPTAVKPNNTSKVVVEHFGPQSNADRRIFVTWKWDKANTKEYKVEWFYHTSKDPVWFNGPTSTETTKQSIYDGVPANADRVKVRIKAISKTRKVNGKDTVYWTAGWSTEKIYDFKDDPPPIPSIPSVKIEKYTLTATLENIDPEATNIGWEVVKDNKSVIARATTKITTNYSSYSCAITAGSEYKVRCRASKTNRHSDWSDYSPNIKTIPAVPSSITTCRANSKTSAYLEWTGVSSADTYDIEIATKREYFDGTNQTQVQSAGEYTHFEIVGLQSGSEYFFRVRAVNEIGQSGWSEIKSVRLGKDPIAPTTWSSTTTVIVGEPLSLYWVHNAEDGSSQTFAELEITIDGKTNTYTIKNTEDEDEKDKTSVYSINTSGFTEGVKIEWRARTAGVTNIYGEWSIQRAVDIYAPPTLSLNLTDSSGTAFEQLTSFPINVSALAGPNTQTPIGYYLSIIANESYETVDDIGRTMVVNNGDEVYGRYFDVVGDLNITLSAKDVDLQNNIPYTITCTVTMNSGLTASASYPFAVAWTDVEYWPDAEIGYDPETMTTYIRPYCTDDTGKSVTNVYLSVYRREFDGSFTEIVADIDGTSEAYIVDPHPSLDYARYRIVAIDKDTGAVSYYDPPGYPVEEKSVIIQWAEDWSPFEVEDGAELTQPPWTGSLLKLPYNINVSDKNDADVSLVKYIGRNNPVSYYGTHIGAASTWNMEIPKDDKETLHALRRLSIWMGDVYVREPSGSGYWASLSVSFNQTHRTLTIPITFDIIRVEGGI